MFLNLFKDLGGTFATYGPFDKITVENKDVFGVTNYVMNHIGRVADGYIFMQDGHYSANFEIVKE